MKPKSKQYLKKCGDFSICSERGDAGFLFTEYAKERSTLYQIVIRGAGKIAKVFDNVSEEVIEGEQIYNLKKYLGYDTIFKSYEPFHIFGFNTLDPNQDWDGRLIGESFTGNDRSRLVCFDGNPVINGKELQPLDYAILEDKLYNVEINDSIVGVFTKI